MPRGKKTCPDCEASVGPRLKVCECGYEFTFKQTKAKDPVPPMPMVPRSSPPRRTPPRRSPPTRKSTPPVAEQKGPVSKCPIRIRDKAMLDDFIEELKSCRADSTRNGGCYSAFLHHNAGIIQVEIQLVVKRSRDAQD